MSKPKNNSYQDSKQNSNDSGSSNSTSSSEFPKNSSKPERPKPKPGSRIYEFSESQSGDIVEL